MTVLSAASGSSPAEACWCMSARVAATTAWSAGSSSRQPESLPATCPPINNIVCLAFKIFLFGEMEIRLIKILIMTTFLILIIYLT